MLTARGSTGKEGLESERWCRGWSSRACRSVLPPGAALGVRGGGRGHGKSHLKRFDFMARLETPWSVMVDEIVRFRTYSVSALIAERPGEYSALASNSIVVWGDQPIVSPM